VLPAHHDKFRRDKLIEATEAGQFGEIHVLVVELDPKCCLDGGDQLDQAIESNPKSFSRRRTLCG
jgi:hypothetical protein